MVDKSKQAAMHNQSDPISGHVRNIRLRSSRPRQNSRAAGVDQGGPGLTGVSADGGNSSPPDAALPKVLRRQHQYPCIPGIRTNFTNEIITDTSLD